MEKGKIKFKPLHEGMGFHPFSDGLPYAPESKAKQPMGTGATAAGRPRFTTQLPPQVRTQLKTARQLQNPSAPKASLSTAMGSPSPVSISSPMVSPIKSAGARPTTVSSRTAPRSAPIAQEPPALIRQRVFAYLLDTVVHAGFWIGTNLAALFLFQFQLDSGILRDNLPQFLLFFMISQWVFIALQEVLFGNSIGKNFFNLEFQRNHRSLFLRSIVFMIGALCLGLGFYYRPHDRLGRIQLKQTMQDS